MDFESNRYARQIQYAAIGKEGQRGISSSHVAVMGCGALGTVAAEILGRAGVGKLTLLDRDVVEWTNLQRQALFDENDARQARAKADAASEHLQRINSQLDVHPVVVDVHSANIEDLLRGSDLVIDASDNFQLRFLLNDWSLKTATPWVHGGCIGATGQVRLFRGDGAPCFRCLVSEPPPASAVATCDTAGVLGSATHLVASLQATEAIKWLSGNRDRVGERVLSIDLWNNRIRSLEVSPAISASCVACAEKRYEFLEGARAVGAEDSAVLCGRDAVQINQSSPTQVDLQRMTRRWEPIGRVQTTPFFVRLFPDESHTVTLFTDGRAVIGGTDDVSQARSLYDRYIGG